MTEVSNEALKRIAEAAADPSGRFSVAYWSTIKAGYIYPDAIEAEYLRTANPQRILSLLSQLEQLQAEIAELKSQLAASEKDAARLDWLQSSQGRFYNIDRITAVVGRGFNWPPTLREAIDAAMQSKVKP